MIAALCFTGIRSLLILARQVHIHVVFQSASLVPSQNLFQSYHRSHSCILQHRSHSYEPAGKEGMRREGLGYASLSTIPTSFLLHCFPCHFLSPPKKKVFKGPTSRKTCLPWVHWVSSSATDWTSHRPWQSIWKISLIPPCLSVSNLLVKINLSSPCVMDISPCWSV